MFLESIKILKSEWKIVHMQESSLNASNSKYYKGLGEYSTQQNIVDLGLNQGDDFKRGCFGFKNQIHFFMRIQLIGA